MLDLPEREGFEPPEPKGLNGFQDRRFRPLSHLSNIACQDRLSQGLNINVILKKDLPGKTASPLSRCTKIRHQLRFLSPKTFALLFLQEI